MELRGRSLRGAACGRPDGLSRAARQAGRRAPSGPPGRFRVCSLGTCSTGAPVSATVCQPRSRSIQRP